MSNRTVRVLLIFSAFLTGIVLFGAVAFLVTGRNPIESAVQPSAIGGPFSLVDQDGKTVTEADLKGRPFLVFFGFTHCPDICPTTLFDVSEVLRSLGPDADRAGALFVTVDPERDTAETMKDYLSSFDSHLRGLTGSPEALAAMQRAYRVYAKKVPLTGDDYTMDHSALVYLMNKDGKFVAPFNLKRSPDEAAKDLRRYF